LTEYYAVNDTLRLESVTTIKILAGNMGERRHFPLKKRTCRCDTAIDYARITLDAAKTDRRLK
jgi:hypothetical protein